MNLRNLFAASAAIAVLGVSSESVSRQASLESQIEAENKIALQGALNNIGPNGKQVPEAFPGIVVASPSTDNPNYFYTWTRDSALTMKMIIDEFIRGNSGLRSNIQDYLKAQAFIQTVSNPSGALGSGRGLGEPKFYVNETRFNGDWGRPQRDGPALRATALITYSRWLLGSGKSTDKQEAKEKVWPVIQNDLNYVAQYWNSTGFDLWEEVSGSSFFTIAAHHRALVEGSALAKQLGQSSSAYDSQAPNILCFLQTFWNGNYTIANINTNVQRTGIDANSVLTSITTFDPEAQCDDATFQPCSPRALANLKVYVDSFRSVYAINKGISKNAAVATGRYAEDIYFGGNPWYLTTLAVAEQLYDAIQQWSTCKTITITDVDLAFWQSVYPQAKAGTYKKGNQFNQMLDAVLKYADSYVEVAFRYTPSSGALSEQYSRDNGTPLSARDLTWSYASVVTMRAARQAATSNFPQVPSWGAKDANRVPSQCVASSVQGTYTPATAAGAPPTSGGCTILVTFNVNASTYYGENIYLSGNTSDLGNWNPPDALPGSASGYTQERPLWTFDVELPANSSLQYHYLRQESDGSYLYETTNRTLAVPACPNTGSIGNATVEDAWVGPTGTPPARRF